ncbi:hypothetical protein FA09DRAFT_332007 [Tilletiopsis washingtonensis]|uniref:Uncharacterized protein n=1 Tax=Tilletiopsis washingtonensis TaxID=58919 RepID=A0A316Z6C7_9BASI|nr:hypothetical protein FA09DRAFT_332007 [Tilletiopsis washingtonensis]PWN95693.1 hypothetical protein FA09DRAFT_332007 [Tilletiopsis washingtonensis]
MLQRAAACDALPLSLGLAAAQPPSRSRQTEQRRLTSSLRLPCCSAPLRRLAAALGTLSHSLARERGAQASLSQRAHLREALERRRLCRALHPYADSAQTNVGPTACAVAPS